MTSPEPPPRLSIVISTRNRGGLIGRTIDSILPQLPRHAELLVFDGASTDTTPEVMAQYVAACPAVRYVRAASNSGIDADYDNAVGAAWGEYVWLFGDDDLLLPGAVSRVLVLLERGPDLVIVDAEVRDAALARVLAARRLPFTDERVYASCDTDRLLADTGNTLSFIGGTIIRRAVWLARERQRYYGTLFVHVGVIFQAPINAVVLGQSLIAIRYGNASWSGRSFEIWMRLWPDLVWSLPAAEWAKRAVVERNPWRGLREIVRQRAIGSFNRSSHRHFLGSGVSGQRRAAMFMLTLVPGTLLNFVMTLQLRSRGLLRGCYGYDLLHGPNATALGRWIGGR